jgi:hypothetical protein
MNAPYRLDTVGLMSSIKAAIHIIENHAADAEVPAWTSGYPYPLPSGAYVASLKLHLVRLEEMAANEARAAREFEVAQDREEK